jgi:hypothetical protein
MSSSDVDLHVQYRIANAPMREFPYPHLYIRDIFPEDFYARLRANLPSEEHLRTLRSLGRVGGDYPDTRLVMPLQPEYTARLEPAQRSFWEGLAGWMLGSAFGQLMVAKFAPYLRDRFENLATQRFADEVLIVRDRTAYSLGPHTDALHKVLSFLFYLPPDASMAHLGTSVYVPKDPQFTCRGGPHHPFDRFRRMLTMEYLPNTLFAFMKTPRAFHGVEPITEENVQRDLLLYDIRVQQAQQPFQVDVAPPAAPGTTPKIKFSF